MNSLKGKLMLRLLVGGILLLGVLGGVFHWRMQRALTDEFDDALMLAAQALQPFIEEERQSVKMDSDVDDMPQFNRRMGTSIFLLRRADGFEVKRSKSLGKTILPKVNVSDENSVFFEQTLQDGRIFRCIGLGLTARADDEGKSSAPQKLVLIVGRSAASLKHTLGDLRNALLLTGTVMLVGLVALLLWGVRSGLKPLAKLADEISEMDAHRLAKRFPVAPLPAELRPIAQCLNELLGRMESAFDREKRFTANVSHELRTPLAELLTLAEVNLLVSPAMATENAASWREVKDVTRRMESLALRLLELARVEGRSPEIHRETVDVGSMIQRIWNRISSSATARGITCDLAVGDQTRKKTDPVLLEIVLTNLIGNAIHHAAPDSELSIKTSANEFRFINSVRDLSEENVANLFERFWKNDASRTDSSRHGLGLALALETAQLLGGSLDARLVSPDSLEFVLRLP